MSETVLAPEQAQALADAAADAMWSRDAVARALARATRFGRFRAADVRSILAIGIAAVEPAEPGERVVVDLPAAEVRSLAAYRTEELA